MNGSVSIAHALRIDGESTARELAEWIRECTTTVLRRKGAVVGLSGGVDSTVVAALCARALGAENVLGVLMPERESAPETLELSLLAADFAGIETDFEDISGTLESAGCYKRRDAAIEQVLPEYGSGWKAKMVLPSLLDDDRLRLFKVVAEGPDGQRASARLSSSAQREIVAATNFKQRVRKMVEYHRADRLDYAVVGTPNRLEYDLGFFVKGGDGLADLKPIAHLYKSQVYALAETLGVPNEIVSRPPTTDTYALEQTQEEFYFAVPYDALDRCLYAWNEGLTAEEAAKGVGLESEVIERIYRDIAAKHRAASYLHEPPLLFEAV